MKEPFSWVPQSFSWALGICFPNWVRISAQGTDVSYPPAVLPLLPLRRLTFTWGEEPSDPLTSNLFCRVDGMGCSLGAVELRLRGAATLPLETEVLEEPPCKRTALFRPLPLLPQLAF